MRQVDVLRRRYLDGSDNINFLLQAQRQVVISEAEFYRSMANYNIALRDLHRQKGSLLAYNQVHLTEGPWANGAQADACHVGRFVKPRSESSRVYAPSPSSQGPFEPSAIQDTSGMNGNAIQGPQVIESVPLESVTPPPQDEKLPAPLSDAQAGVDTAPSPIAANFGSNWTIPSVQRPGTSVAESDGLMSAGPSWSE